jgi:signal transduction histidine kinase
MAGWSRSGEDDGVKALKRADGRLILAAGLGAWLFVALPTVFVAWRSPSFPFWALAWLLFGFTLAITSRRRRLDAPMAAGLALQGACVVAMVSLLCNGFEGMLLVVVAAQLGLVAPLGSGFLWLFSQTLAVTLGIAFHWSTRPALMLMSPYLGFQVFGLLAFHVQARLAERSRLEERLRIAGELHDVLGHHLTALSLNLEVAAHQTEGEARESVRVAQSLARLLLGDVRGLVHAMKEDADPDLAEGLATLVRDVPSPQVHVDWPDGLVIEDRRQAHAFFRCAQEFVTNSIRHGRAANVWISLREEGDGVELAARDDGSGAGEIQAGDGLSGMRRRLEELGGSLVFESALEAGFAVTARLPVRAGAR